MISASAERAEKLRANRKTPKCPSHGKFNIGMLLIYILVQKRKPAEAALSIAAKANRNAMVQGAIPVTEENIKIPYPSSEQVL